MKSTILILCIFIFLGCNNAENENIGELPLAEVGNEQLFPSDLEDIGKGMLEEDSIYQIKNQINKWVRDQLMLQVAKANIETTDKINKMVKDYEATLIMNEYEEALISQRVDTEVTPQQLADYYEEHKNQYISGISWVRCHFVKAQRNNEGIKNLRKWFKSENGVDFENIKLFCANNNTAHILNEDLWVEYDKLVYELPANSITERHRTKQVILDRTDDIYQYLLQIFEYRDKNDATPLPQLTEEISRIIIHQRRNKILQEIRKEVYEKASKEGNFKIY